MQGYARSARRLQGAVRGWGGVGVRQGVIVGISLAGLKPSAILSLASAALNYISQRSPRSPAGGSEQSCTGAGG